MPTHWTTVFDVRNQPPGDYYCVFLLFLLPGVVAYGRVLSRVTYLDGNGHIIFVFFFLQHRENWFLLKSGIDGGISTFDRDW